MTDSISSYGRRVQTEASRRDALDKAAAKATPSLLEDAAGKPAPAKVGGGHDQLQLSNVAQKAMAEPDFDRAKVESIKQAIQDGQYQINPRKIAESFLAVERMIE
jgi:negative regulator of flagellin synthesis FlgM